ncbi:MAG TPA: hypothetical protein VJ208_03345 [Candidatus Nanoarchaeia archaeon]|nr:hypothetical protein [Candidatus Nanoarchaeia archaeon]
MRISEAFHNLNLFLAENRENFSTDITLSLIASIVFFLGATMHKNLKIFGW